MTPYARDLTKQALDLIETSRYRLGVSRFITQFIDHWAFQQTGLYPPSEEMPNELGQTACEISHLLSAAMNADPTSDILGYVLSESGFYKQGTQFYPTPPEVARLMALMTFDEPQQDGLHFYEPCCGTGINTIVWLERLLESRGPEGIAEAKLYLEDIDRLMVKGCMLQLMHYFESRQVSPALMSIVALNTISRQPSGVAYYAEQTQKSMATGEEKASVPVAKAS
ncbi:restriction endonuclease subunit M [Marinobacterium aestuariivivens]|uniref:Restriction endonuclease subunit M n=1 Tax=Marinobacterium aestuariivivens TaxID=1698799 RepID=A0ABW2A9C8_9GAMM